MSQTIGLAPDCAISVEEATEHHWIGVCSSLVILLLHDGSQTDPQHVRGIERAVAKLVRRGASTAQLLVVFSPTLAKAPSPEVRQAIVSAAPLSRRLDRAAAVVLGTGFLPAIHRGAITGILSFLGLPTAICVTSTIREGLAHTYSGSAAARDELARFCEERVARP